MPKKLEDIELKTQIMTADEVISYINSKFQKQPDCFQFEVFPTNKTILPNMIDNNNKSDINSIANYFDFDNINYTGLKYIEEVPSCDYLLFSVRSKKNQNDIKTYIDFGDGNVLHISDAPINDTEGLINLEDKGDHFRYTIKHTYDKCNKKYIVSVVGDDCYQFDGKNVTNTNLVSRVFGNDLICRLTREVKFSSFATKSLRILQSNINEHTDISKIIRFASMFYLCNNLQHFHSNTSRFVSKSDYIDSMFGYCKNLKTCNFRLSPEYIQGFGFSSVFAYCEKLRGDILSFLPFTEFVNGGAFCSVKSLFLGCKNITCSDYDKLANILWNNTNVQFDTNTTYSCFLKCSDELRSHIPYSWGGGIIDGEFDLRVTPKNNLPEYNMSITSGEGEVVSLGQLYINNAEAPFTVFGGTKLSFRSSGVCAGNAKYDKVEYLNGADTRLDELRTLQPNTIYKFSVKGTTYKQDGVIYNKIIVDFKS